MCGIFGIYNYGDRFTHWRCVKLKDVVEKLFFESETRGSAASGIALLTDVELNIFKDNIPGSRFPFEQGYQSVIKNIRFENTFKALLGHTRFPTKGSEYNNYNNHPIIAGRIIGVHNGSVYNDDDIFSSFGITDRKGQVDSEAIFQLINLHLESDYSLYRAVKRSMGFIRGGCTIAVLDAQNTNYLVIARGIKSPAVFLHTFPNSKMGVFSSDDDFITNSYVADSGINLENAGEKWQINPGHGIRVNLLNGEIHQFELSHQKSDIQTSVKRTSSVRDCPNIGLCEAEDCHSCYLWR